MQSTWEFLKGKKTYVGLGLAAAVLVAQKLGVPLPDGLTVNADQVNGDLYRLLIAAFMRHGISTGA